MVEIEEKKEEVQECEHQLKNLKVKLRHTRKK